MKIDLYFLPNMDWLISINGMMYSFFGLLFPALISMLIIVFNFKSVLLGLKKSWFLFVLTLFINLIYFYYQNITGWDNEKGVHIYPALILMIFNFPVAGPFRRNQFVRPHIGYALMWLSIIPLDLLGGFIFKSKYSWADPLLVMTGGKGVWDNLFISPLVLALLLYFIPKIFALHHKKLDSQNS